MKKKNAAIFFREILISIETESKRQAFSKMKKCYIRKVLLREHSALPGIFRLGGLKSILQLFFTLHVYVCKPSNFYPLNCYTTKYMSELIFSEAFLSLCDVIEIILKAHDRNTKSPIT